MFACQKADGSCFLGQEEMLMVEFMQQGTTVISEVCCETLQKLCSAIQNKRHRMPTCGVMLEHFNWEHPPYSPDLTPSSYHLFKYL
jgi:hypothetical protein